MLRVLRLLSVAVAAAGAVLAPIGLASAQDNRPVTVHGVTFPAEFADGQRISMRNYEPEYPGQGFSAGYRHRGAISTIYIYDAGVSSIPDDLRATIVVRQFQQAKDDITGTLSASGSLNRKSTFTINDMSGRPRLTCEGYERRLTSSEQPLDTYLCLGVANSKFLKVRTTTRVSNDSAAEVRRFLSTWIAAIWK